MPRPAFKPIANSPREVSTRGEAATRRRASGILHVRDETRQINDISPLPETANPERREMCKHSLKLFCEQYFPYRFPLRWSDVHLKLLETMESSVLRTAGQIAYAFPRGMGKTTIAEVKAIWTLLYGHRKYVVVVAGKAELAVDILRAIMLEFETNDLLYEDFPEVCYPIRCLDGSYIRAAGQHVAGERTRLEYKKGHLILPTIEGSVSSGAKVHCFGINGNLRGLKHTLPGTGEVVRPDLVIIDDPQNDRSAKSESTTAMRERIIDGAIMGLAGPTRSITAIMPCTVIRTNDLAERFLDRDRRPEWQGQRTKLLLSFPTNMDLWHQYNDLRKASLRELGNISQATEFYKINRAAMDEGASVAWQERFDSRMELSAIQSAMNLFFRNPLTFASEYQNEPLAESKVEQGVFALEREDLLDRVSGLPRGTVPANTLYITTGVDVQKNILFYLTTAWVPDFGGVIVDYGTYPKQQSLDGWVSSNPPIPMGHDNPGAGVGPNVYRGLVYLRDNVFSRPFMRDSTGETLYANRVLIDAGWSESTESVFNFCRDSRSAGVDAYLPSIGRGVGAAMIPMNEWSLKHGEIRKWNSRILPQTMRSAMGRHASFDGNMWKTLVAERLSTPKGSATALEFHHADASYHDVLISHLCSERAEEKMGRGRKVKEWSQKDKHNENHLWDCLIMSAVGANLAGLEPHTKVVTVGDLECTVPTDKPARRKLDTNRIPKVEAV